MAIIDTLEVGVEAKECKKCEYKTRCDECAYKPKDTKPKTNRDKLSTMTNEELARWLTSCKCCVYYTDESCAGRQCSDGVLKWLEKEVEGNGA